jgi:serine/threonine-protein kinase RsbW
MSEGGTANEAVVRIRSGPLVGAVLGRVVGMLAARAQCPIDRLDDAILLTDAVAAHAPAHARNGHVCVVVAADDERLELRVAELHPDGAQRLLADGDLPGGCWPTATFRGSGTSSIASPTMCTLARWRTATGAS